MKRVDHIHQDESTELLGNGIFLEKKEPVSDYIPQIWRCIQISPELIIGSFDEYLYFVHSLHSASSIAVVYG
jgi:hypothetical protein